MTWGAATDTTDTAFLQAVDWFARRTPIVEDEFQRDIEQARRQAFWIAGVTQADVIRDVFDSLKSALVEGTPFEEWQNSIGPKLEKAWLGKLGTDQQAFRTETILRNWVQGAYGRARWQQMNEPAVVRLRPYRMFDAVRDSWTSEICAACDGTVLPADDPWWESHQPPLHHRCRSGIRALTAAKAKALGITEKPPEKDPQDGFGSGEEWQGPKPKAYPKEVAPPPPPEPVKLPEPPKPPMLEKAAKLNQALLLSDGGYAAREIIREQIQQSLPGAIARSGASHSLQIDDAMLNSYNADGAHHWNGAIAITTSVRDEARANAQRLAAGKQPVLASLNLGLRVLLHEELHGHSRLTPRSYAGAARVLEEAGTELSARQVLSDVTGLKLLRNPAMRTYQRYIDAIIAALEKHAGGTAEDAMQRILAAHSTIIGPGNGFATAFDYEEAWGNALGVTPQQRAAILSDLRQYAATAP